MYRLQRCAGSDIRWRAAGREYARLALYSKHTDALTEPVLWLGQDLARWRDLGMKSRANRGRPGARPQALARAGSFYASAK